jgi:hypothetical protein
MVDVEPGAYLEGDDVADRRRHGKEVALSATTIFLGRPLGLYLAAISGELLANSRRTLATLNEMARSGPWMGFVTPRSTCWIWVSAVAEGHEENQLCWISVPA